MFHHSQSYPNADPHYHKQQTDLPFNQYPADHQTRHDYNHFSGVHSAILDPPAGLSRETIIEPALSSLKTFSVVPQSIYGIEQLPHASPNDTVSRPIADFFHTAVEDDLAEPDTRSIDCPLSIKPRVHHADIPIKTQQAYAQVPMPSSATIEVCHDAPYARPSPPSPLPPPLKIPLTPDSSMSTPPSGCTTGRALTPNAFAAPSSALPTPQSLSSATPSSATPRSAATKSSSSAAGSEIESMVHEGIRLHEQGQVEKATQLFRIAAEKQDPLGMFLYGVSLRHGWGCKRSERLAFQYLQKAAEHAVLDLNSFSSTVNTSASQSELVMAIYELGVSFRHGWGCKKNKETAVYFFKIAADLGDADAQNDLGHCYYYGHGVKKDLYMAAKYYRKADKQGHGIMGNSWIYKTKYDKPKP
ncbi:uncharacterized protein BYT42DRAFT_555412 [Radiomyces spectabilis]|uniref:uncharacterized protein n=1 Tax=Radiomyces spectabilis TaxID=64574 RepID=UPI002220E72F|nr:uncharacterized protein BYT42DRAFT_555412 [Radiomyces spectabilis]KAI8391048.1 hypothetical protein BYT42DRAFT_555412 [Radiomyces spectabilis]